MSKKKPKRSYKFDGTIRQKMAMKRIVENRGVVSKSMREVGYAKKTAKNPKNLTNSRTFKKELKPLLDKIGRAHV